MMNEQSVKKLGENTQYTEDKPMMTMQANMVLLGTHLLAAFEKKADSYKILIQPTDSKGEEMSIQEMIDEVNKLIKEIKPDTNGLDPQEFSNQFGDLVETNSENDAEGILDKIKICLKQIFLYIQGSTDKQNTASNTIEYAFDLEIKNEVAKDFTIVNISSISFAVWNTTREGILDRMELHELQELLDQYSK